MTSSRRPNTPGWLGPVRDVVVTMLATAAFVNEVFFVEEPRGLIVWVTLGMLGLPAFSTVDRFLQRSPVEAGGASSSGNSSSTPEREP